MGADHPADLTLVDAARALRAREFGALELTEACLQRIADRDGRYGGWIRVYEKDARRAAREADMTFARGEPAPLTGLPVGLKDTIGVRGYPLTADSAVLEGNVAPVDSTAWARLRAAGMVLLGHLHCGEFAYGVWGVNPWDPSVSPGGSSSGNGIALATRTVPASVGSDARGSLRIPAAFNGVTAVKPTYGSIPTSGCIPLSFSYDTLGPVARQAADCSLLLSALAGSARMDVTDRARTYPTEPTGGARPLSGIRIGVPVFAEGALSAGIGAVFDRFQGELAGLGAELVRFAWPANPLEDDGDWLGGWTYILGTEMAVVHEQFNDREHLYRDEFRRLFALVTKKRTTGADYLHAQQTRTSYAAQWREIFATHKLTTVVQPVSGCEAYGANALEADLSGEEAAIQAKKLQALMAGAWNDTSFPVIAVPAGFSPTDGSPVGMQVVGLPHSESRLLQLAVDYQSASNYHRAMPPGLDDVDGPAFEGPRRHNAGPQPPFRPVPDPFSALSNMRPPAASPDS